MDNDLDTLATAFHAAADDGLKNHPQMGSVRPSDRDQPADFRCRIDDAGLGARDAGHRVRDPLAAQNLGDMFPYLPGQSDYNKLRKLYSTMTSAMGPWCGTLMPAPTMCGSLIRRRSNTGDPERPHNVRSWPAGPGTVSERS